MRKIEFVGRHAAVALAVATPALASAGPPHSGLEIEIENLRNHRGQLRVCLTREARYFPDCASDPAALTRSLPASADAVVFRDLAEGPYAVAIVHDENGNGKLDKLLGIPREGFGFSRNPQIRMGAPSFAEAEFAVGPGVNRQVVRLRYIL